MSFTPILSRGEKPRAEREGCQSGDVREIPREADSKRVTRSEIHDERKAAYEPNTGRRDISHVLNLLSALFVLPSVTLCVGGVCHKSAVSALLVAILVLASYDDIRNRRIRNITCLFVLATGFLNRWDTVSFLWRTGTGLAVFILLSIIYYLAPKKSIGGGDVKMLASLAFALGPERFALASAAILVIAIFLMFVMIAEKTAGGKPEKKPLMPLICAGVFLSLTLIEAVVSAVFM